MVKKKLFLSTFAIRESSFRRWVCDETLHPQVEPDLPVPLIPQPRELTTKLQMRMRRANTREWLDLLPKVPSHYCRASSQKVYVEPTFRSILHLIDLIYYIYLTWFT